MEKDDLPENSPNTIGREKIIEDWIQQKILGLRYREIVSTRRLARIIGLLKKHPLSTEAEKKRNRLLVEVVEGREEQGLTDLPDFQNILAAVRAETIRSIHRESNHSDEPDALSHSVVLAGKAVELLQDNQTFPFWPALEEVLRTFPMISLEKVGDPTIFRTHWKKEMEEDERTLVQTFADLFEAIQKTLAAYRSQIFEELFRREMDEREYSELFFAENNIALLANDALIRPFLAVLEKNIRRLVLWYEPILKIGRKHHQHFLKRKNMGRMMLAFLSEITEAIMIKTLEDSIKMTKLRDQIKSDFQELILLASQRVVRFPPAHDTED